LVPALVVANDPRPLQRREGLSEEYGWTIDYEDPPFGADSEVADDTSPEWRLHHPNGPAARIPAGGAFQLNTKKPLVLTPPGEKKQF